MEPKNQRIEKENHLPSTSIFGFQPLIFQGVVAHSSASKKFRCESFLVFLFWDQKCKAPEFSINKNILPPKKYIISPPKKKIYLRHQFWDVFFMFESPGAFAPNDFRIRRGGFRRLKGFKNASELMVFQTSQPNQLG